MAKDWNGHPGQLTFSQRYGYEPLPEPMRLEKISEDVRREIWNAIREQLLGYRQYYPGATVRYRLNSAGRSFSERVLGKLKRVPEDEINTTYGNVRDTLRETALHGDFNRVLDLVEVLVNDRGTTGKMKERLGELFNQSGAYRLDVETRPYRFFPQASREQGESAKRSIEILRKSGMEGAVAHLRGAAEHINIQQYADSIADSIRAVESVARVIDPRASKTLTPALKSLERDGLIRHSALREGFSKLYGYTNDEEGIRHALLARDGPDAGLDEAMFMFGACASFAAYLASKRP